MVGRESPWKIAMNSNSTEIIKDNIIDGRAIAASLFKDISERVAQLPAQPLLCDVVVGEDPVSLSYVKIKARRAEECGLAFSLVQLPSTATDEEVCTAIISEQLKENLCGLIVQLPLPPSLKTERILQTIGQDFDVDVINPVSSAKFYDNEGSLVPPTAGAIVHILNQLPINLYEENILVLGQGELVGKPVFHSLKLAGFNVLAATEETENRAKLIKDASVIITGVGKAGILKGDEVSEGVVVIDAGTSESGGSIAGDVDFMTVAPKARFITPSPGGVGPVTVAKLLENVLIVAENRD
jgi:methylenetetrahydrofolate dehydrogenase (NADP+)/methenyltetrahydrofolate cyclohydrolase